jgi:DNA gyrase inhibitor
MSMKIKTLPPHRIAYVRITGPYGQSNAKAIADIKSWASERGLLVDESILCGIPRDDPSVVPPDQCRYDAGIVVSHELELDSQVESGNLHGGRHAVSDVPHTAEGIRAAWSRIHADIESRRLKVDVQPIFEMYTPELLERHLCQIWVPLQVDDQR